MPPWTYTMIHRDAAMSPEEMAIVIDALRLMEAAD